MGLRRFEFYWYGNALTHKTSGDEARASRLKKVVRIKAAYLFAGLLSKQTYGIGKWNLADGSEIQVQVMRTPVGERVFARVWAPDEKTPLLFDYYLESAFVVPSQETGTTFTTTDSRTMRDINDARFIHNARVRDWSSFDPKIIGFIPKPNGDDLVKRTLPLALGFDQPKETLPYSLAYRRWVKTWRHFGDFDVRPQNLMLGRGSGTSTGKMVLYQRAKLGRKVENWIDENDVQDDYVLNDWLASNTCRGLHTDQFGDYWKVLINNSVSVTFTKLEILPEFRNARDSAPNATARLFVEAFALAYSTVTEETYTVNITNAPTINEPPYGQWKPVAYSWHFNWSGSRAVMVAHRGTASYEVNSGRIDEMQSEIWTLDLAIGRAENGDRTPEATLSRGERYTWARITDVQSDLVFVPGLSMGSKVQAPWSSPGDGVVQSYPQPAGVPLYAWFAANDPTNPANDTICSVWYSRNRTELTEQIIGNYAFDFQVYGTTLVNGSGSRTAGVSQSIAYWIKVGGEEIERVEFFCDTSLTDIKRVAINVGEEYSATGSSSGSSIGVTDNSNGTTVTYSISPMKPDYLVVFDYETRYWQPTVTINQTTTAHAPPSASLVIPHDCAEGAMITGYNPRQRVERLTIKTDKPTPSIKYQRIYNIRGFPSNVPLLPSSAATGRGQADYDVVTTSETFVDYDIKSVTVGRTLSTRYKEDSSGSGDSYPSTANPAGAPEGLAYSTYDPEEGTKAPFSIFEAFGGEMMVRGAENHFLNDFPELFGEEDYPPVLIGSI